MSTPTFQKPKTLQKGRSGFRSESNNQENACNILKLKNNALCGIISFSTPALAPPSMTGVGGGDSSATNFAPAAAAKAMRVVR
jgi:hypothetical protein